MHVQAGVDGYDVFTRGLAIGPQTMVMHHDPTKPLYLRYQVVTFGLSVGAFFRWEFNSFEVIVRDGRCYPIGFANTTPDMALISLYRRLVDDYYEADRFAEFCDQHLAQADECMATYVESPEVDAHLVATVKGAFPPHEHEQFIAHYRGLLAAWAPTSAPPDGGASSVPPAEAESAAGPASSGHGHATE